MLSALFLISQLTPSPQVGLASRSGLTVAQFGIPVIKGSSFQFYSPGWKKGYYSSHYQDQRVSGTGSASQTMSFQSEDNLASGTESVSLDRNRLTVDYRFEWKGAEPALVEVNIANLWAPLFETGNLTADGSTSISLAKRTFKGGTDSEVRRFGPDSKSFALSSAAGSLQIASDTLLTLFDARGYDYATGRNQLWLGAQGIPVSSSHPATLHVELMLGVNAPIPSGEVKVTLKARPIAALVRPNTDRPLLVPKPVASDLHFDQPTEVTQRYRFPEGKPLFFSDFERSLEHRFVLRPSESSHPFSVSVQQSADLPEEGYRLEIKPHQLMVSARTAAGFGHAMSRAASLCFIHNGHVCLPTGTLTDYPATPWRGVHLFVGPKALDFHQKLWSNFLGPLGFNKVVLQCERTAWQTLPGIETPITMPRKDLGKLFDFYRSRQVEPIPLIQSFGHAEWMFNRGKNLDLALNPQVPYAVDPRKPRTRLVLDKLWDEAIEVLKPKTIHFGLDEVDMRGWPKDPSFVNQMWTLHLPFLASIAARHHVRMMLWGDECLAPNEAVDAQNAPTEADAQLRRSVLPKGALIGDWHYAGNPDPRVFQSSLKVWKANGQTPIASTWFNPENIRAFSLADRDGVLQTTWAGYESSEQTMVAALNQYAAMVLAAEYSWNPRPVATNQLGYDPMQVLKRMYFDAPSETQNVAGQTFAPADAKPMQIGRVQFDRFPTPVQLYSALKSPDPRSASAVTFPIHQRGRKLYLALGAGTELEDGDPIANVEITVSGQKPVRKTLYYGLHVRIAADPGVCVFADRSKGLSCVTIDLPRMSLIENCKVFSIHSLAGLTINGLSVAR